MGIKFSNNASANITQDLTSTATSVSVTVGKGDLFPSLNEGDYFYATLAGNNGLEIVKVTNRVDDTMTIVRAQDNTTALSFNTGDFFELRIVAADFTDTLSEMKDKLEDYQDVLETQINILSGVVSSNASSQSVKDAEQDTTIAEVIDKVGQMEHARKLDSTMHLDSLTVDGFYLGNTTFACTEANGYPETANLLPSVQVSTCGSMVIQHLSMAGARLYGRVSYDKGSTWQSWLGMGGTKGAKLVLYVSKSGSDSASGADADHPVLTIARAIRIATAVMTGVADSTVELRVGEGSWGNLTLKGLPFVLALKPYDGAVPTEYSASLPVYGSVTVTASAVELTGFVANALTVQHGGNAWIATGYKRMGTVRAEYGGRVIFASANTATNLWEVTPQTVYADGVVITTTGGLVEMYYLHIKLAGDVTVSNGFVVASRGGKLNMHRYATMFDSTAFRVTGKKCDVKTSAVVNSMEVGGTHDFFTLVLPGSGYAFEKGAIINGYTYGQVNTVNGNPPDENGNVEAGGLPLGFEYFQTNPNVQAGSLPMVGGEWSRTIYASLWEWVQKQPGYLITEAEWQEKADSNGGAVPFYSDGDGSTTFRVPALTVWCKGQSGNEAVGDYLADMFGSHSHNVTVTASGSTESAGGHTHTRGTMNITGVSSGNQDLGGSLSGAFYAVSTGHKNSGSSAYASLEGFDASRSWTGETSNAGSHSHTVTLNTTVSEDEQGGTETRPRTIVGLYCVVAYGSAFSSGAIDLDDVRDLLLETQEVASNVSTVREDTVAAAEEAARASYGESGSVTLEGVAAELGEQGLRFSNYLPLTGGTMTGIIVANRGTGAIIINGANTGLIRIFGGTSASTGANLDLYGGEDSSHPGDFILRARNSAGYKVLEGNTNGGLTWDGKPILTLVESWSSGYSWYRKWSDGWIEQGGISDSVNHATVTLPVAMTNTNYTITLGPNGYDGAAVSRGVTDKTTTTFKIKVGYNDSLARNSYWMVAGYYK